MMTIPANVQVLINKRQADIEAVNQAIELLKDAVIVDMPLYDDLRTAYKALNAAKVSLELQFRIDKNTVEFYEANPIGQGLGMKQDSTSFPKGVNNV